MMCRRDCQVSMHLECISSQLAVECLNCTRPSTERKMISWMHSLTTSRKSLNIQGVGLLSKSVSPINFTEGKHSSVIGTQQFVHASLMRPSSVNTVGRSSLPVSSDLCSLRFPLSAFLDQACPWSLCGYVTPVQPISVYTVLPGELLLSQCSDPCRLLRNW